MNIVLSCYANREKASFVLEKGGKVVNKEVFPVLKEGKTYLKEYIFESIIRGLKHARNVVNHDDLLLIGVQNSHVAEWLNGQKEYKGYEYYLDEISDIIETLDCRYLFGHTSVRKAKLALKEGVEKPKLEGALDIFSGL
jgi:hypothetical protein